MSLRLEPSTRLWTDDSPDRTRDATLGLRSASRLRKYAHSPAIIVNSQFSLGREALSLLPQHLLSAYSNIVGPARRGREKITEFSLGRHLSLLSTLPNISLSLSAVLLSNIVPGARFQLEKLQLWGGTLTILPTSLAPRAVLVVVPDIVEWHT